jgi:hypothetical protein
VLAGALAMAPADRYTAREFAQALAGTGLVHSSGGVAVSTAGRGSKNGTLPNPPRPWVRIAVAGGMLVAAATAAAVTLLPRGTITEGVALDTTRVFVAPAEVSRDMGGATDARYTQLLSDALNRWDSVAVVDEFSTRDALRSGGAAGLTDEEALKAALRTGAGRLVRASAAPLGDSVRVQAVLYDVPTRARLHQAVVYFSAAGGANEGLQRLADALLLRGLRVTPTSAIRDSIGPTGTPVLPAAQSMARALASLDDWDLLAADSLLGEALRYDPRYARAAYWQAQTRAWRDVRPDRWVSLAERAVGDSVALMPAERERAVALLALGRAEFDAACAAYEAMTATDPTSFAGWHGIAQCHDLDHAVVRDVSSSSGWRFRRSYGRAIHAYARAYELLPQAYRSFARGAYAPLHTKFFTSPTDSRFGWAIERGGTLHDTLRFYARPAVISDSLAFVPYPERDVVMGKPETTPPSLGAAVSMNRETLRRITAAWSAALPGSAGVREAVATTLEMFGDQSAADTLRVARKLSRNEEQRIRLAASEVLLRTKFALPDRPDDLRFARRLADSLLQSRAATTGQAAWLASVAALTGRCEMAAEYTRQAARGLRAPFSIPHGIVGDAQVIAVRAATDCNRGRSASPSFNEVATRLPAARQASMPAIEYMLFGRAASLQFPLDSGWVTRLARVADDYLLGAQAAFLAGDTAASRELLRSVAPSRRAPGVTAVTVDAAVPEARLWLALGDTIAAVSVLESSLRGIRSSAPGILDDPVRSGSVGTAIELLLSIGGNAAKSESGRPSHRAWREALAALQRDRDDRNASLETRTLRHPNH